MKDTGEWLEKADTEAIAAKTVEDSKVQKEAKKYYGPLRRVFRGEPITPEEKKRMTNLGGALLLVSLVGLPFTFPAGLLFLGSALAAKVKTEEKPKSEEKQVKKIAVEDKEILKNYTEKLLKDFSQFLKQVSPEQSARILEETRKRESGVGGSSI